MPSDPGLDDDRDRREPAGVSEQEGAPGNAAGAIVGPEEHEVDPRAVTVARLVRIPTVIGVAIVPFIGVTVGWALGGVPSYAYLPLLAGWIVLFVAALSWAYQWPALEHRHLRYRVDETGVRIRRGVLWRKVISIPTSRVQHTDVSQGPVQRQFELATLTVYTAGTEGASIGLHGLEQSVARRLRDHLLPDHLEPDQPRPDPTRPDDPRSDPTPLDHLQPDRLRPGEEDDDDA